MGLDPKQHHNALEHINSKLNLKDHEALSDILATTRLSLHNALAEDFLLVDKQDTIDSLELIAHKLGDNQKNGSLLRQTKMRIDAINRRLPTPGLQTQTGRRGGGNPNNPLVQEVTNLETIESRITADVGTREVEYTSLKNLAKNFEHGLKTKEIGLDKIELADNISNKPDIELEQVFVNNSVSVDFTLCTPEGTPFKTDSIKNPIVPLKDVTGKDYEVVFETTGNGPFFDADNKKIHLNELKIIDIKTKKEINYDNFDLDQTFSFGILGKISGGAFDVANFKKLSFRLDPKNVSKKMDLSKQITQFNNTVSNGKVSDLMLSLYNQTFKTKEKELIKSMLTGIVPDDQQDKMVSKLLQTKIDNGGILEDLSPVISDTDELINGFTLYFFSNVEKPTKDDLSSSAKYNDYLKKHISKSLSDYLSYEIERQLLSTSAGQESEDLNGTVYNKPKTRDVHGIISTKILEISQALSNRKKDDSTEKNNLSTGINTLVSPITAKKKLRGLLSAEDITYMRFLANQEAEIPLQTVPLEIDSKNNPISSKQYQGKLSLGKSGTATFTIQIDKGESFEIRATDHIALIKHVLADPRIPYDKMKVHIAYSILKSLLEISKKSGVKTEYMNGSKFTRLKLDKNNAIVMEEIDDSSGLRTTTKTFSEQDILDDNNMDDLQDGIIKSLETFHTSLNQNYAQYKNALDGKLLKHNFPRTRVGSPIKKLMNLGKRRNLDFSFTDVPVSGIKSPATVSFVKNYFEIKIEGIEKPLRHKNLGKLLNSKKGGEFIFQGMERQIIATIYQHLIKNLRSNSKIAKKNFFVKDALSQKMYFVDKQGNIGYMALGASSQKKEFGTITDKDLSGATMLTSEEDKLSFYQNPFLMGKMMKAMNTKLRSLF